MWICRFALAGTLSGMMMLISDVVWAKKSVRTDPPLTVAVKTGNLAEVRRLLDSGVAVNAPGELRGQTPIMTAALAADEAIFNELLARGAAIDLKDEMGYGVLHYAAWGNNTSIAAALIGSGIPVDADAGDKLTPLLCAASIAKNERMVSFLLERGADPNLRFGLGRVTPLHRAAGHGNIVMIRTLLAAGARLDAQDHDKLSPLAVAEKGGNAAAVTLLKQAVEQMSSPPLPEAQHGPMTASNARSSMAPSYFRPHDAGSYAVVVGIESYMGLPPASFAERDSRAAAAFIRSLGVPERNVMVLSGNHATKTAIEKIVEAWLPNNFSPGGRLIFYFSGHGAPDPKTNDAYLMPYDGDPQYLTQTGYPLKRLYKQLGALKAKQVVVVLDSCFSGAGGRSVLAKGTRPLVGKVETAPLGVKTASPDGKLIVLTASGADQVSGSDEAAGYGLFSKYFFEGLDGAAKDAQGRVTVASLYSYLKPKVQDEARRANREQTPQLMGEGAESIILREK